MLPVWNPFHWKAFGWKALTTVNYPAISITVIVEHMVPDEALSVHVLDLFT